MKRLLLALSVPLILPLATAHAEPLRIAHVSAAAVNCLYGSDCRVVVEDLTSGVVITTNCGSRSDG
jgi:hypothetical protein